jgi:NAD+ kinase
MKIVLSPNPYRDKGLKAARNAERILRSAHVETVMCLPFPLGGERAPELPKGLVLGEMKEELKDADLLICFGGDGTILHAAKDANAFHIPILGVNLGSVGFMAELEQGDLNLLTRVAAGNYRIERRMMLDVKVCRGQKVLFQDTALNDAVVTKGAVARVIELAVFGDGGLISEFSGDGVIICTPTGSTAYSMSAGGPIAEPTSENLIVTPICAHALHARALVLDRDRVVAAHIRRQSRKTAYLSVDGGKAFKLYAGDTVEVTRAATYTNLVRVTERSFYDIINQKLGRS